QKSSGKIFGLLIIVSAPFPRSPESNHVRR
ncbi:unnamed protein product, partial [Allacma fusca]